MPRPANRSSILPIATTGTPAAFSRSSSVGANGVRAKSRRFAVRLNAPGAPTNGRAITRPTPCPSAASSYAISQIRYSSGDRDDVLVRGDLEDAVGGGVDDRLAGAMCSAPSSSMIAVPEATLLPSVPRRCGARTRRSTRPGNRRENGERPIEHEPHHLPVPGDRVLARRRLRHPAEGAARRRVAGDAAESTTRPRPRRAQRGQRSGTAFAMLPSVLLPRSPYRSASGSSPMPTLSRTMRMTLRGRSDGDRRLRPPPCVE